MYKFCNYFFDIHFDVEFLSIKLYCSFIEQKNINMNSNLAKEISDNGIVKIKNFLSDDELKKFSDIVKFYKAPKGHKDSFYYGL